MASRTAFISGPLDPDDSYFSTYYIPHLDLAIASNESFVIGPMYGIDELTLHYLLSHSVSPSRITVHMAEFEYHTASRRKTYSDLGVNIHCEGETTRQRDKSMTEASDYDILRYRTEKECKELYGEGWWPRTSSTEMNERRRGGDLREDYRAPGGATEDVVTAKGKSEKEEVGRKVTRTKEKLMSKLPSWMSPARSGR